MNFDLPTVLVVGTAITGFIWLTDALFFAAKRKARAKDEEQAKPPLIVDYSKSFFPILLIVLILRSFIFEPFRIPSGSMLPTLDIGDFIVVDKNAYGIRLPVLNKKIIDTGSPKRGEVFVFRYPVDPSVDYIKRVIGLPGDVIEYRDKVLYINGKEMKQVPIGRYTGVGGGKRATGELESIEDLDGVKHSILTSEMAPNLPYGCVVLAHGPFKVPEGRYFAMGDNRDNSSDSRCWGTVPDENLVGRARFIWMNFDTEKDGFPIDWSRIGKAIE